MSFCERTVVEQLIEVVREDPRFVPSPLTSTKDHRANVDVVNDVVGNWIRKMELEDLCVVHSELILTASDVPTAFNDSQFDLPNPPSPWHRFEFKLIACAVWTQLKETDSKNAREKLEAELGERGSTDWGMNMRSLAALTESLASQKAQADEGGTRSPRDFLSAAAQQTARTYCGNRGIDHEPTAIGLAHEIVEQINAEKQDQAATS